MVYNQPERTRRGLEMSLAATLNRLRTEKRQSLQEVADAVGLSKTHLWELEKGRATNPSVELLMKLAQHYMVTLETLVQPSAGDEQLEKSKALAFFRDFQTLSEHDRAPIQSTIERLKQKP
jgi:transcriptional regulator with XRE-family HTH domain